MDILKEYFFQILENSLKSEELILHDNVIEYLNNLLVSYVKLDSSFEQKTFVDSLNKANEAIDEAERIKILQKIGDQALFLSGFFVNYVNNSGGLRYYSQIGSNAYAKASLTKNNFVFEKLSKNFIKLVGIFYDCALQTTFKKSQSISDITEVYELTQSKTLAKRLIFAKSIPLFYSKDLFLS